MNDPSQRPYLLLTALAGLFAGFWLWTMALRLTGKAEPWDTSFYLCGAVSGLIVGICDRRLMWQAGIVMFVGFWIGQLVAIATCPQFRQDRVWIGLAFISTGVGSLEALVAVLVGQCAQWYQDGQR